MSTREEIRQQVIEDWRKQFCQWTDAMVEKEIDKRITGMKK